MGEPKKMKVMQVWVVLNPERYIKKSTIDGSFAVFDEQECAISQSIKINDYNKEGVFTEEAFLCNKGKFSEYAEAHEEMYSSLERLVSYLEDIIETPEEQVMLDDAKTILAKARGEL